MNSCPSCSHDLVNIIYGYPTSKLIDMARSENIALGGTSTYQNKPTHYCYGCHETFPTDDAIIVELEKLFSN